MLGLAWLIIVCGYSLNEVTAATNKTEGNQFRCYSCMGGLQSDCAKVGVLDWTEVCSGKNAQCYEAYVKYQGGAFPLIQRRCWVPPDNTSQTNFCKWFNNPNGKIDKCRTCQTDLCNTSKQFWLS